MQYLSIYTSGIANYDCMLKTDITMIEYTFLLLCLLVRHQSFTIINFSSLYLYLVLDIT